MKLKSIIIYALYIFCLLSFYKVVKASKPIINKNNEMLSKQAQCKSFLYKKINRIPNHKLFRVNKFKLNELFKLNSLILKQIENKRSNKNTFFENKNLCMFNKIFFRILENSNASLKKLDKQLDLLSYKSVIDKFKTCLFNIYELILTKLIKICNKRVLNIMEIFEQKCTTEKFYVITCINLKSKIIKLYNKKLTKQQKQYFD